MDDEELERLAAEELLREAKQGAARAVIHGALGWKKDDVPRPNKRFLTTTLANTMQYNHRRSRSRSSSPRHKYKIHANRGNSSHESSYRDNKNHYQRSREDRREDRESRRDKSAKRERSDVEPHAKKHGKAEERVGRKNHRIKRSHSHS